jgi:hypothetical protein
VTAAPPLLPHDALPTYYTESDLRGTVLRMQKLCSAPRHAMPCLSRGACQRRVSPVSALCEQVAQRTEALRDQQAAASFVARAKAWWVEYVRRSHAHRTRPVKVCGVCRSIGSGV